jgi:hypothetical protein
MRDWPIHTPHSEPGQHRLLLQQLPDQVDAIAAAARNVICHYRAELADLPEQRRNEINSRWLESILDLDQDRHPSPSGRTARPIEPGRRVLPRLPCSSLVRCVKGASRPGSRHDGGAPTPEQRPGTLPFDPTDMPAAGVLTVLVSARWRRWRARRGARSRQWSTLG